VKELTENACPEHGWTIALKKLVFLGF